ncbi:ABC transporter ATP-binding protein [Pseudokineococcus sp. 1T1Z-3]|uniref:ABC transporter ATP-binding protein n=1 Tax=Pseudokineococcus sp. 1T1Z-3 TaxID=3132745 RepID=UPI0030B29246
MSEKSAAVVARDLVKDYGSHRALDGLDLRVERGEVLGFLGPNGAGKSTTIRLLLDLLRPTSGDLRVLGESPREGGAALRSRIGYLPGELALPRTGSAGAVLTRLARLRRGAGEDALAPLAERLGLDLRRPVRSLSKGNRQKVGLVHAFAAEPELLVLDEPTSGLDPLLQREFLALVREARDRGATVFLSSHVLGEVEDVADRVALVRAGRVVDAGDVASLRRRAGQHVELVLTGPEADDGKVREGLTGLPGVTGLAVSTTDAGTRVTCLLHGDPDPLLRAAARYRVTRWSAQDRELEELFLDAYRVGDDARGVRA